MAGELILSGDNSGALAIPSYLQGAELNVSKGLLATAGMGGNRIGLKSNRFRIIVNGKEESVVEENHLDVIVLGAVPHISRIFYEGAYVQDEKASPTCYSADGIAPPDDVKNKQSSKCEICPQNQKGSKIVNGQKIKACGYFQRLIVMIAGDPEGLEFQLDVKSMGIFGESLPQINKFNIRDYTKLLANRGADVATLVTRLTFDTNSSVPKLLFSPARFINPDEFAIVQEKVNSDTVQNMLKINMTTIDLANETDLPATGTEQPAVEQEAKPTLAASAPKAQPTMTAKANGATYESFVAEGWTDEDMVAEGYATYPAPPKPATPPPPPKATTPAPPQRTAAAPAAKPAAAPATGQRRAPGRPPGSTNKPAQAAAAPAATPAAAPAPNPRVPVPSVTKAHPVPAAAETTVQETTTDDEVAGILAGLV
ncbi:MAG: hypothetical protein V4649_19510 [Bacteroidota bacterium]